MFWDKGRDIQHLLGIIPTQAWGIFTVSYLSMISYICEAGFSLVAIIKKADTKITKECQCGIGKKKMAVFNLIPKTERCTEPKRHI